MPAGTDLQDWAPREGSSGDDRYSLPTTTPELLTYGTDSYSNPPDIDEVNAGSGINQIRAEINRRNKLYYETKNVAGYSALSYLVNTDLWTVTLHNAMKSAIDTIRTRERLSAYSWPTTLSNTVLYIDDYVLAMRKALATDHFLIQACFTDGGAAPGKQLAYAKSGAPTTYPADTGGTFSSTNSNDMLHEYNNTVFLGSTGSKRFHVNFRLPANVPNTNDAEIVAPLDTLNPTSAWVNPVDVEYYRASSFQDLNSVTSGDWGNIGTVCDAPVSISSSGTTATFAFTGLTHAPSTNYTYVCCIADERSDTTTAFDATKTFQQVDHTDEPYLKLYT